MTAAFTPAGDPEAMRALARELMGRADLITDAAITPSASLAGVTFEGPAAARARGTLDGVRSEVLLAASRLRDTATRLSADAVIVERMNADLEREAEEAAAAAAANTTTSTSTTSAPTSTTDAAPTATAGSPAPETTPSTSGAADELPTGEGV